jgi:acyl-CoA thioester hydrolase
VARRELATVLENGMSQRDSYPYFLPLTTRWKDNDIYGHVNNVEYYSYFDTVINTYLIVEGGLDIRAGAVIGLCAESHCKFLGELAFPETIEAGLRVEHLGNSSVRYGIGLFRPGHEMPVAEGWFVHVFVGREQRRPVPLPYLMRTALDKILVPQA